MGVATGLLQYGLTSLFGDKAKKPEGQSTGMVEGLDETLGKHWFATETGTFIASEAMGDNPIHSLANAFAIGGEVQGKKGLRHLFDLAVIAYNVDQDLGGGIKGALGAVAAAIFEPKLLRPQTL